jgi:branched-chain amino acid transport system substrate-binding protein
MRIRSALLAAGAVVLLLSGCGSGVRAVRIGVVADCAGFLGGATQRAYLLAAAELPLLERGASLVSKRPSDGVRGAQIGGHEVQLVFGCSEWTVLRTMIEQIRWLVEAEHVDVVIGPTWGSTEGIVIRELAHRYPAVTFVVPGLPTQETTLRDPAPNLFRFWPDAAQSSAGLGSYAYHQLGWRRAAVLSLDYSTVWPEAAGFVAEFCALGGHVERIPTAPFGAGPTPRIPPGVDGVALMSQSLQETLAFAAANAAGHGDLARRVVLGPSALTFFDAKALRTAGRALRGVVVATVAPTQSTPAWARFRASYAKYFPGLTLPRVPADAAFVLPYADAMEAVTRALASVGDIGQLQRALSRVRLDSPQGPVRLDADRQAVVDNYLSTFAAVDGKVTLKASRVVPDVDQTFAGYFSATTPPPTASSPVCHRAVPPSWAD